MPITRTFQASNVHAADERTGAIRDDMHLGPEAHEMVGEGIARDTAESHGDSWFAHDSPEESKDLVPSATLAEKPSAT